ncbi:hypothetical protein G7A66_10245 [Altererythrobacter sp. SALINAS58]|uniref:hypothetical protein n=1 Tax=Alteripontixanthobacter muriae TaxID=2705546 RepID=UPI001575BF62|nr:hypothetical protein [Alteripontixanthobacter muriae]NTZ43451.1 hypothetical protein [Alteripontixanthobacter muriae]
MADKANMPTREERLAAKLRENLRRRKAQARAMVPGSGPSEEADDTPTPDAALSNPDAKS